VELALQAVQLLLEPAGSRRGMRGSACCCSSSRSWTVDGLDTGLGRRGRPRGDRLHRCCGTRARSWRSHFDDLMKNRLPKIAEATDLGLEEIRRALEALRRLSLSPGGGWSSERNEPIIPDAIVEYDEDQRPVRQLPERHELPNLRLNREYAMMSKDRGVPKQDRDFLKKNLSNAQWLMDAVEQRAARCCGWCRPWWRRSARRSTTGSRRSSRCR
jgi:hypothetical protein